MHFSSVNYKWWWKRQIAKVEVRSGINNMKKNVHSIRKKQVVWPYPAVVWRNIKCWLGIYIARQKKRWKLGDILAMINALWEGRHLQHLLSMQNAWGHPLMSARVCLWCKWGIYACNMGKRGKESVEGSVSGLCGVQKRSDGWCGAIQVIRNIVDSVEGSQKLMDLELGLHDNYS